jgi:ABC-type polar amino acid transport system ATPase subunit
MNHIVEMRNICKSFGPVEVLKDFNLQVNEGEKIVIIGPSGSGKSTVLRCINCLEPIQSGSILFEEQEINDKTDLSMLRRNIGMVFQRFNLFPHKTVLENVIEAPVIVKECQKRKRARLPWVCSKGLDLPISSTAIPKNFQADSSNVWRLPDRLR